MRSKRTAIYCYNDFVRDFFYQEPWIRCHEIIRISANTSGRVIAQIVRAFGRKVYIKTDINWEGYEHQSIILYYRKVWNSTANYQASLDSSLLPGYIQTKGRFPLMHSIVLELQDLPYDPLLDFHILSEREEVGENLEARLSDIWFLERRRSQEMVDRLEVLIDNLFSE